LLIRLFGFSFDLLRLSTLPFAAGSGILLYALKRRAGLSPPLSLFGTLTLMLSPVFVPLAASFMTDVPGFFFLLLALYGYARAGVAVTAGQQNKQKAKIGWLLLATLAGLLGGTARQVVWLVAIISLPYIAWMKREHRRFAATSAALWVTSLGVVAGCILWFRSQPYAIPESVSTGLARLWEDFGSTMSSFLPAIYTAILFALPVFAAGLTVWRPALKLGLIPLALLFFLFIAVPFLTMPDRALAPWMDNIVTRWGILVPGTEIMGIKPEVMPVPARALLTLCVYGLLALMTGMAVQRVRERRTAGRNGDDASGELGAAPVPATDTHREQMAHTSSPSVTANLLILFGIFYVPVLVQRAAHQVLFDRYLIPLLPVVILVLLLFFQRRGIQRVSGGGWLLLAIFAAYGIAATHDYLALSRARLAAASAVIASGVPRTRVTAGLEYDAWTELITTGYINDPRLEVPKGAYRPQEGRWYPVQPPYWYWERTPSIDPLYFVVLSPQRGLVDSPLPPVPFRAWLPPFNRRVFIQMSESSP
jgi:hypothetical protein